MNSSSGNAGKNRQGEQGYILLVLLVFVTLLSISFLGVIQSIDFQIKRDREEEMIHRGVQYSRAIRNFVNVFHRYPSSMEELENTNNIRSLRKRYKDPITGKDFKVLHLTDMPGFIRTTGAGASAASLVAQQQATSGASASVASTTDDSGIAAGQGSELNGQTEGLGRSPDNQGDASQTDQNGSNASGTAAPQQPLAPRLAPSASSQGGGGLVIGIASTSKQKSFRVFNKKDHYNEWLFIYDPSTDHPGVIMTPSQPPLRGALQPNQQQNGQAATQASGADSGPTSSPNVPAPGQQ